MSMVSIVLSIAAAALAWFTVGPEWLPLATVSVAAVLAFSQTVTALRAKDWGHWSLRALVIALIVLIALPTIGRLRPAEVPAPAVAEGGGLALPTGGPSDNAATTAAVAIADDLPSVPTDLEGSAVMSRAAGLAKRLSRTRYDFDAGVRAIGEGVEPAFAYVRDTIGFDSYRGVLRGEKGAFLSRAGNSWDRAMLLSAILRAKGIRTRFATAQLDDRAAAQLFDRVFVLPASGVGRALPSSPFSDRLKARATRDLALVRGAMAGAWPTASGVSREDVIEELREHAWVQAEVGAGWRDLDPSLPGATPGRPLASPESTFDEMPEERFQHVTIRVVAETLAEGDLAITPRLEWTARAPEVIGRRIFLTHVPAGVGATGKLARMASEQWRPALWLGGLVQTGDPVHFGTSGNSAGTFFFGDSETTLVAEWLELDFDQTGGRLESTRRALFNRATDQARSSGLTRESLAPIPTLNNGPIPALALHNLWFTAGGHDLAAYADAAIEIGERLQDSSSTAREPEVQLNTMALANFPFLVASEHLVLPSVNDIPGVRLYADAPRVFIFSLSPSLAGPGSVNGEYDLHRDRVRAVVNDASLISAAVERKVWFGLLEGALEHELTASEVSYAGGTAANLLTTSALAGAEGVVAVREGATDQIASLAGNQPRAERMRVAVARGSSLVVPRPSAGQPARGWWEIANNGDTRAVIDGDLGGSSYSLGKGPGPVRWGGGTGMPRPMRTPPTGGSGSQEYLTLLTTIALAVIIAIEFVVITIEIRALMTAMTVIEAVDGDAAPPTP